jgi:hypothetical protein
MRRVVFPFIAKWPSLPVCIASLCVAMAARGDDSPSAHRVGAAADALPGMRRVGVIEGGAKPGAVSLAGTMGYGFTESQPTESGAHHRVSGVLAAGVNATSWLAASLALGGRYDLHPKDAVGRDDGWVFDPRLAFRSGGVLGSLAIGVELAGTLPGSESLSTSLDAASFDGKLLLGSAGSAFTFGSFAGFRYDRSAAAGTHASQLRFGDRLALGLSDFNSILLGVGGGYRARKTFVYAEASGDVLTGKGAPPFSQSPLRASVGARQFLSPGLSLEGDGDLALSSRPAIIGPSPPLIPIEPRFTFLVGVRYEFGEASRPKENSPPPVTFVAPAPVEAPKPADTDLEVDVTDDLGSPIKDATVEAQVGDKKVELQPDDDGKYRASHVPLGRGKISIRAPKRKTIEQPIDLKSRDPLKLQVRTEPVLPSGQVRGLVRSYDGKAISAKISVEPGGQQTRTDAQGFFQLDVPPGKYEVVIEAKGYAAQRRSVEVEKDGVLILNADLARGR